MLIKEILGDIGFPQSVVIQQDNTSAIMLFSKTKPNLKLRKYVDIRRMYLARCVRDKLVSIVHVPTTELIADILTKSVSHDMFTLHRDNLGVRDLGTP